MIYTSVFDNLIWCIIGPKSFLFGTAWFSLWASGAVNFDYIVTNSISSLLIGSRCILNGAHTNHFRANLAHASRRSKNPDLHIDSLLCTTQNDLTLINMSIFYFMTLINFTPHVTFITDKHIIQYIVFNTSRNYFKLLLIVSQLGW